MSKFRIALKGLMFLTLCQSSYAAERVVALTIDDLPFVGPIHNKNGELNRFSQLVNQIEEKNIPATGFIIAGSIGPGQEQLLNDFKQKGFGLGNHTYTHINLNRVGASRYIEDLDKAETRLQGIMTYPKYFRYPYLAEGRGNDHQRVKDYLASHSYTIAPVTIDSKDYKFNGRLLAVNWRNRDEKLDAIKTEYLAYIDKQITQAEKIHSSETPEILLVHANLLNSHAMGDVIELFQKRGYKFISLDDAIRTLQELDLKKAAAKKQVLITQH